MARLHCHAQKSVVGLLMNNTLHIISWLPDIDCITDAYSVTVLLLTVLSYEHHEPTSQCKQMKVLFLRLQS